EPPADHRRVIVEAPVGVAPPLREIRFVARDRQRGGEPRAQGGEHEQHDPESAARAIGIAERAFEHRCHRNRKCRAEARRRRAGTTAVVRVGARDQRKGRTSLCAPKTAVTAAETAETAASTAAFAAPPPPRMTAILTDP